MRAKMLDSCMRMLSSYFDAPVESRGHEIVCVESVQVQVDGVQSIKRCPKRAFAGKHTGTGGSLHRANGELLSCIFHALASLNERSEGVGPQDLVHVLIHAGGRNWIPWRRILDEKGLHDNAGW